MVQALSLHRISITIRGIRSEATKAASAASPFPAAPEGMGVTFKEVAKGLDVL